MGGHRGAHRHASREVRVTGVVRDGVAASGHEEFIGSCRIADGTEADSGSAQGRACQRHTDVGDARLGGVDDAAVVCIVKESAGHRSKLSETKVSRRHDLRGGQCDRDIFVRRRQHRIEEPGVWAGRWRWHMLLGDMHDVFTGREIGYGVNAAGIGHRLGHFTFGYVDEVIVVLIEIESDEHAWNARLSGIFDAVIVRVIPDEVANATRVVETKIVACADLKCRHCHRPHGSSTADKVHANGHRALDDIDEVGSWREAAEEIEAVRGCLCRAHEQIACIKGAARIHIAIEAYAHGLQRQLIPAEDAVFICIDEHKPTERGSGRRWRIDAEIRITQ